MEEIAKRAGVGVGTLYRSFGNRSGLAEAVFIAMLEELLVAAGQMSARRDPWRRLVDWLQAYGAQLQEKSAMLGVLRPLFELKPTLLHESKSRAEEAFTSVLQPAQRAGLVRSDVTSADLLQLMNHLFGTGVVDAAQGKLWLGVVTAGIRPERR